MAGATLQLGSNRYSMAKPSLTLIWHEAGNPLYHDRFRSLAEIFELEVLGPRHFQGMSFTANGRGFKLRLFRALASSHWLTYLAPRMIIHAATRRSDVLYVHEEPHSLTAFFCALIRGRRKLILESSAINMKGNLGGFNPFEMLVYRRAFRIVPKNYEVRGVLANRGAPISKLTPPVGNGVSRESFFPIAKEEARALLTSKFPQTKMVFKNGDFVIGFAGRIWRPKGIEIFKSLEGQHGIRVMLCGPVVDEGLVHELAAEGICVLPQLDMEELRLFYNSLDLFILPSRDTPGWREQFGRVCIESIYCGTPAIGSHVGGIPMAIGKDFTFPPDELGSLERLVNALREIKHWDSALAAQTMRVESRFSWAAIAYQIGQLCETGSLQPEDDDNCIG